MGHKHQAWEGHVLTEPEVSTAAGCEMNAH